MLFDTKTVSNIVSCCVKKTFLYDHVETILVCVTIKECLEALFHVVPMDEFRMLQ